MATTAALTALATTLTEQFALAGAPLAFFLLFLSSVLLSFPRLLLHRTPHNSDFCSPFPVPPNFTFHPLLHSAPSFTFNPLPLQRSRLPASHHCRKRN